MASSNSDDTSNNPRPQISIIQKLALLPALLRTGVATLGAAVFAPFRGQHAQKTFKKHVVLAMMRSMAGRFAPAQIQWIAGSTGSKYAAWCTAHKIAPRSVYLPQAKSRAFWLGDPKADTVILYFHGGGFAVPAGDGHFSLLSNLVADAEKASKKLSVLVMQYDLAPEKQYPRQLKQCVELLRYATTDLQLSPRRIMLGGDSAGGSLVFGILLHLLRRHPEIDHVKLSQPLRGAFAASPWIDFDMDSDRFRGSDASDAASVSTLKEWARNYAGSRKPDEWMQPGKTETGSWRGLKDVVDGVLVTTAKEEVMAGDVKRMVTCIEGTYPHIKLVVAPDDFHAEPALGGHMGLPISQGAEAITSWVTDRC